MDGKKRGKQRLDGQGTEDKAVTDVKMLYCGVLAISAITEDLTTRLH